MRFTIKQAFSSLLSNKLRSFLTMLGLIIGVFAVISMLSIGVGVKESVDDSIQSMGSNMLIVSSGGGKQQGVRGGSSVLNNITAVDVSDIMKLPSIKTVTPVASSGSQIMSEYANWSTQVMGVWDKYFEIRGWNLKEGRMFNDSEEISSMRVVILGSLVADKIFGTISPLGKNIRIKNAPYLVIGILESKGQSLDGRDQDDVVFVPLSTAQKRVVGGQFKQSYRMMMVQAKSKEALGSAQKEIEDVLTYRHNIDANQEPDFSVRNMAAMAETASEMTAFMTLLLGSIASISLLVGGIGVMNIMLVAVTERTREIGIRMAIGANRYNIMLQFLVESVMLSLLGCFLGIILGISTAYSISVYFDVLVIVSWSTIIIPSVSCFMVGVFFGLWPAYKASKLNPVEALRMV